MDRVFASGRQRYLEFGLGGSTLLAIHAGMQTVVAVDSDPEWVAAVQAHPEIAERVRDGKAAILHGDIGPVGKWGAPLDRTSMQLWPNYIAAPWAEWGRRGELPDLVYIDGRFRVACALSVFLVCANEIAAGRAPHVLLHDVVPERTGYAEVFEFFDRVESVESLYLLAPQHDRSPADALSRLLRRQFSAG